MSTAVNSPESPQAQQLSPSLPGRITSVPLTPLYRDLLPSLGLAQTGTSPLLWVFPPLFFSVIVVNRVTLLFCVHDRLPGKETGSPDLSWVSGLLTENVIHC